MLEWNQLLAIIRKESSENVSTNEVVRSAMEHLRSDPNRLAELISSYEVGLKAERPKASSGLIKKTALRNSAVIAGMADHLETMDLTDSVSLSLGDAKNLRTKYVDPNLYGPAMNTVAELTGVRGLELYEKLFK